MNSFKETTITELHVSGTPTESDHVVRLGDLADLVSGVAAAAHTYVAGDITDFSEAVDDRINDLLSIGDGLLKTYDDAGNSLSISVQAGSGIVVDGDGVAADFGSGVAQVARGNHTHAQLHDALTVVDTNAVDLTLSGQQLQAALILADSTLEVVAGEGLRVVLGTESGVAAAGDHTHAQMHDALTKSNTQSIQLTLTGQLLSADLLVDPAPPSNGAIVAVGSNGAYVPTGTTSGVAAAGNHTHSGATTSLAGFMSAADKAKLDAMDAGSFGDADTALLYALKTELSAGQIWVGNESGVAAARTVTGDLTMDSDGVARIAAGVVSSDKLAAVTIVDNTSTGIGYTGSIKNMLSWMAYCFNRLVTGLTGTWYSAPQISNWDTYTHVSSTANPHSVTASQVGLGNISNKQQLPLDGSDNMAGPIQGVTQLGIGTTSPDELLTLVGDADEALHFKHGTTNRLLLGILDGAGILSGVAASGDAFVQTETTDASLWFLDSYGRARMRVQELIDGDAGTALNVHYAQGYPAIRAIVGHGGTANGFSNLGGVQIAAQGANLSTTGGGALHFLTPTGDSANGSTDAPLALRMSILQDGKIGFGTSSPAVAFEFANDGGVIRIPRKSTSGDPASAANGDIYYNANSNKFRVYENGAWADWVGSGGGGSVAGSNSQIQFNNSGSFGASSSLVWDSVNHRLGVGLTPSFTIDCGGDLRLAYSSKLYFGGVGSGDTSAYMYTGASGQIDVAGSFNLAAGNSIKIDGTEVLNGQADGWALSDSYSTSRGAINSGTVTLTQLADQFCTMKNSLRAIGIVGPAT